MSGTSQHRAIGMMSSDSIPLSSLFGFGIRRMHHKRPDGFSMTSPFTCKKVRCWVLLAQMDPEKPPY
jgi:hypothetical protein